MSRTVPLVLAATATQRGERAAMTRLRNGVATDTWTWRELSNDARRVAKALLAMGLRKGQPVVIIGYNSPEWVLADIGAILAGSMPAGIYTTSSQEQCRFIAQHCGAFVAFTENAAQSAKFVALRDQLPELRAVVQFEGSPADGVMSWQDFLAQAEGVDEQVLEARIAEQSPEDPATLIYTSGTTGDPKAVVITHDNLVWTADAVRAMVQLGEDERCVSYLPLSHIAEQLLTIHGPMSFGSHVTFAESMEKLPEALTLVRPTYFLGVPRVWEKIESKLRVGLQSAPALRKAIAGWARTQGLHGSEKLQRHDDPGLGYRIADKLVYSKLRARLGLDQCRINITAAAPIARSTLDFFHSLGMPIYEVYGMSECTGPATVSLPDAFRIGATGQKLLGTEVKIAEDGEVCMRGRHVFAGYYKNPEATREALDDDGWLHSGDIGSIDEHGYLRITDRKKELLITAGGENVAPQPIENRLRSIDGIAHAVVVGDRQRYLGALLTLDPERLADLAERAGSRLGSLDEAASSDALVKLIDREIATINSELARVQTIKKFRLLRAEFSIDGGELTATMKVKRKVVTTKYAREIASLYDESP